MTSHDKAAQRIKDLVEAQDILDEYTKPNSHIDMGNLFHAACVFRDEVIRLENPNPSPGGTTELEERSRKCKHPEESVLTISGKHQPWEGTCGECGVDVRLRATSSGEVEAQQFHLIHKPSYKAGAISERERILGKIREALAEVKFVKEHSLYWDYSDHLISELVKIHKGNAVGGMGEIQLAARKALAILDSLLGEAKP